MKTGEIEESYKRICRNIVELNGMPFEKKKIAQTMLQKASVLSISDLPRLVIFGFDQDQKMGDFFKFHIEKLEKLLGKDRLLVRGNPNNFTKGISFVSQKDSGK